MDEHERKAPATKGDIADSEERVMERLRDSEERVMERLRDIETKLLGAFYGYAKSNDKRVLETEANESVLRARMATLESRVTDVEERQNRPPQQ
jgi:hypothetical protein